MTIWFVSRHSGAIAWAKSTGIHFDKWLEHLEIDEIRKGDVVYGVLPIAMAAQVCEKGARFISLDIHVSRELRGQELSSQDLSLLSCSFQEYEIKKSSNSILE